MIKTAVITGASRGIGRACAVAFAKAGYGVLVNYVKNEAAAEETKKMCEAHGVRCVTFRADVRDENEVRRMIAFAECELGGVGVLVNNAGVGESGLFTDMTREKYDRVFDTNVWGAAVCAREAAKVMIRSGGGRIVFVSSMWGVVGASCEAIYSASKAAVIGLTKALAKELAPSHITVNCVAPGVIDTEMNACYDEVTMNDLAAETPVGRIGTPEDVARAVAFLASEGAGFVTGEVMNVSGGFYM